MFGRIKIDSCREKSWCSILLLAVLSEDTRWQSGKEVCTQCRAGHQSSGVLQRFLASLSKFDSVWLSLVWHFQETDWGHTSCKLPPCLCWHISPRTDVKCGLKTWWGLWFLVSPESGRVVQSSTCVTAWLSFSILSSTSAVLFKVPACWCTQSCCTTWQ